MTEDDSAKPERRGNDPAPEPGTVTPEAISTQRVFKKSSSNNKLTIYLGSRDVIITNRKPEKIRGVILLDPEYLQDRKVYGQITLTFRYGREDEEVMGLKFCNEAIMTIAQLYPKHERSICEPTTPLQEALLRRLGPNAYPFSMEVTPLAPPSVQLVPAKEYNGAPIGTSYDVRAYLGGLGNEDDTGKPAWDGCLSNRTKAHRPDEKVNRRTMVRMGIRVLQIGTSSPVSHLLAASPIQPGRPPGLCPCPSSNDATAPSAPSGPDRPTSLPVLLSAQTPAPPSLPLQPPPQATAEKPFLLSDGKVKLEASLDKAIYSHGEAILVNINVRNHSNKSVRRIKVFVVQHVDVCMFSNGKFKNVVAMSNHRESPPLGPGGATLSRVVALHPARGATKNWIALEDTLGRAGYGGAGSGSISAPSGVSPPLPLNSTVGRSLAASVSAPSDNPEDRNVFAIYVSYYVKVKLLMGPMGGEVSVKLPFVLTHSLSNLDASSPAHSRSADRASAEVPTTPPPQPKLDDTSAKTEPSTSAVEVIQHDPPDSVKPNFPAATSSQAMLLKSTKNQELLKGADVILKCDDPDTS